jgi:hypothetical protein
MITYVSEYVVMVVLRQEVRTREHAPVLGFGP